MFMMKEDQESLDRLKTDRNWLLRCGSNHVEKQTEAAVLIRLAEGVEFWIPKAVILGFAKNISTDQPGGLLIEEWFAQQHFSAGGPYCQIDAEGNLI